MDKTCERCRWWEDDSIKEHFAVPRCTNPINFYVEWDRFVKARTAHKDDTCGDWQGKPDD